MRTRPPEGGRRLRLPIRVPLPLLRPHSGTSGGQRTARPLLALALAFALGAAAPALACDCKAMPVAQRASLAQAIFVGRVVSHVPLQSVRLSVVRSFKGPARRQVDVPTARSDCGYFVPPVRANAGDEFLVFLAIHDGVASAPRCLGSAPLGQAGGDLRYLRTLPNRRAARTPLTIPGRT